MEERRKMEERRNMEEGKRKTKGFKRNQDYREQVTKKFSPYHRIYADGYGGQNSMGAESYQGAKGGFVLPVRPRAPLR